MLIITIIIIVIFYFFIHYLNEKDFKKAASSLALVLLATILGLLADEAVRRIDSKPETPKTSTEVEATSTNNNNGNINNNSIAEDAKNESIVDLLFFITPMSRKYTEGRNKELSPDWLLILFTILSSYCIFVVVKNTSKSKPFRIVLLNIIKGLIASFINCYIIFFFTSYFMRLVAGSSFSIDLLIYAIFLYIGLFFIMAGAIILERDLLFNIS